jgi:GNAT superfamily N-acetyltransferase
MAITIRALDDKDIEAAERLRRLAFGTMAGLPDPMTFRGDAALLPARRWAYPDGGLVAEEDGEIVGAAMANHWGSLGIFGPIVVHPARWRQSIARQLLAATMPTFERWGCRMAGLFTFPESPAHIRLYQTAGFWPRGLTAIMTRRVASTSVVPGTMALTEQAAARRALTAQCAEITNAIFAGLDLTHEIDMVIVQALGDVILLTDGSRVAGFAICHAGAGSEAGTGQAYIKFAAVRSGPDTAKQLTRLIEASNAFAQRRGASEVAAGVNLGRMNAYRLMLDLGFRTTRQGVAMHRPWIEAYDRTDTFALDDWR